MRLSLALLVALLASLPAHGAAQAYRGEDDEGYSVLGGVLRGQASVSLAEARTRCLPIAPRSTFDGLVGSYRGRFVSVSCRVAEYEPRPGGDGARFSHARYSWEWIVARQDSARGPVVRDTIYEGESVLFERVGPDRVRPVWQTRYDGAMWAWMSAETAPAPGGGVLVAVLTCVNGTGGCFQEFVVRRQGRWREVTEAFWDQLPAEMKGSFWKSIHIDPVTLRGEGGYYRERDANCCPSRRIHVQLALRGDSLVLVQHRVVPIEE